MNRRMAPGKLVGPRARLPSGPHNSHRGSGELGHFACQVGETGQGRRPDKDPSCDREPWRFSIVAQPDGESGDPNEAEVAKTTYAHVPDLCIILAMSGGTTW